jgi:putative Mn2+ efflux pump MntP
MVYLDIAPPRRENPTLNRMAKYGSRCCRKKRARMDGLTLFGVSLALAMDAFAVALGAGLVLPALTGRHLFRLGFHFGLFQALMPVLGWLAGLTVQHHIAAYDHWIAFGLLGLIGTKMIRESFNDDHEQRRAVDPTRGWTLVVLSVATSIDALAVGLTLAVLEISIWIPAVVIGIVCGGLTLAGMFLGRRIGANWGKRVERLGGLVLLLIGCKILLEHTLFS